MGLAGRSFMKRKGRSLMTTTAVTVAVALLVALQSLAAGFLDAQEAEIRDRAVDVLLQPVATRGDPTETGPRAAGIQRAHEVAREVAALDGVAGASPTLEAVLVARKSPSDEATQVLAQGVVPGDHLAGLSDVQREKFDGYFGNATDLRYANGTYEGPRSEEVVVNTVLADQHGLTHGDTLLFAASATDPPQAFRVVGVFETPYTGTGVFGGVQIALFQLSELQEMTGVAERDAATRIALRLDDATREDEAATRALLDTLAADHPGFVVLTRADELQEARERAAVSAGFYTAVAYVSLVVSALFVASVMLMEVQERKRELGILRAIGFRRASVFRLVAIEALLYVGIGTALGVGLGYFVSESLGDYFARGYGLDLDFTQFTLPLALASALQSLVIGLSAALYPAWRASRVDALETIRRA